MQWSIDALHSMKRRRTEPLNHDGYSEYVIATIGNVDAGKSSLVGVLTNNILDDGNGLARSTVFVHPHERETGRTSDISWQYLKDEDSKRIISFVDLAGHEMYIKTTITGLTSAYPDLAIVCISDIISQSTKDHMGLCVTLGIPFIVLFTKVDFLPKNITDNLIRELQILLKRVGKKLYQIKEEKEIDICIGKDAIVPYALISNKTGQNINLVKEFMRKCEKRSRSLVKGFVIEHIYQIPGHGRVVSGVAGMPITKGMTLYMGPFERGMFVPITIKNIHNDYRFEINKLNTGQRGCLNISIRSKDEVRIRKGMVLSETVPENICKRFLAKVKVYHHHTTIKPGYNAIVNIGTINEPATIVKIYDMNNEAKDVIRSGDLVVVEMEFMKNLNFIESKQSIVFRDGNIKGIGEIVKPINLP